MGLGGISVVQLLVVLLIVLLIFGTKRLRQFGGDLGGMFKGIKEGFKEARGAADELAPELREAIDDVKALHRAGSEFTGSRPTPYVRMSDGSNCRRGDPNYLEVDHRYFDRKEDEE